MEDTQEYDKNQELILFGIDFTKEKNYIFEHWRIIVIISLTTLILLLATMPKSESNIILFQQNGGKFGKLKGKFNKESLQQTLASAGETARKAGEAGLSVAQTGMIRLAGIIFSIATTLFFLIVFMPITALFFIIFISIALLKPKIVYMKSL